MFPPRQVRFISSFLTSIGSRGCYCFIAFLYFETQKNLNLKGNFRRLRAVKCRKRSEDLRYRGDVLTSQSNYRFAITNLPSVTNRDLCVSLLQNFSDAQSLFEQFIFSLEYF